MRLNRREFMLSSVAIPMGVAAAGDLFIEPSDRELLLALAKRILPDELTDTELKTTIEKFERWVSNYRAGAEENHGYGTGRIDVLPADPWPKWRMQLRALTPAQVQNIEQVPEIAQARSLGSPLAAPHVALALLSWFYASPEANDLCYRARIARDSCRPLNDNPKKPSAR